MKTLGNATKICIFNFKKSWSLSFFLQFVSVSSSKINDRSQIQFNLVKQCNRFAEMTVDSITMSITMSIMMSIMMSQKNSFAILDNSIDVSVNRKTLLTTEDDVPPTHFTPQNINIKCCQRR